jgi:hypothetical protein
VDRKGVDEIADWVENDGAEEKCDESNSGVDGEGGGSIVEAGFDGDVVDSAVDGWVAVAEDADEGGTVEDGSADEDVAEDDGCVDVNGGVAVDDGGVDEDVGVASNGDCDDKRNSVHSIKSLYPCDSA